MTDNRAQFAATYGAACHQAAAATGVFGGDGETLLALLAQRSQCGRVVPYHNLLGLPMGDAGQVLLVTARRHHGPDGGGYTPSTQLFGRFSGPGPACLAFAQWLWANPVSAVEVRAARQAWVG